MFINRIHQLFSLVFLLGVTSFVSAMQRSTSTAHLREVRNESAQTVYLYYNAPSGRRMVHPIGSQETWNGFVPIPALNCTLSFVEPVSGTVFHVLQVDPMSLTLEQRFTPYYVPIKLRRALSAMDMSHLTGIKITENYTQEYVRSIQAPDGALRLTISPMAFGHARGPDQSGVLVERLTPLTH